MRGVRRQQRARSAASWLAAAGLALALGACGSSGQDQGSSPDPEQVDAVDVPQVAACRDLRSADLLLTSNATATVPCDDDHTAVTIAAADLPDRFADVSADDPELARWAAQTCTTQFQRYLGADESTAMRTVLDWAWFRPSDAAWDDGARWYRCDLTGGSPDGRRLLDLPTDAQRLLAGVPEDDWMACANGAQVQGAPRVPCTSPHEWRAVSTIKLGETDDPYPGDAVSEKRTRSFCQDSVAAWLRYPDRFDFGYTWFHRAEWERGNRRSVCWAKTTH